MNRPLDKFRKGSIAYSLVENDWEDLTMPEIADVLITDPETIRFMIYYIKKRTGYVVPYKRRPKGKRASELSLQRRAR